MLNFRNLLFSFLVLSIPASAATHPELANSQHTLFLIGQSSLSGWNNFVENTKIEPDGGSIYYEVSSNDFLGNQKDYLNYLAAKKKYIEVGISWKDNPPHFVSKDDNILNSIATTQCIARGSYTKDAVEIPCNRDSYFTTLINFINANPTSKFLLRLDYEVSSNFHCDRGSYSDPHRCDIYKNAFAYLRYHIKTATNNNPNVFFEYHPVRGEYDKLYPGNDVVDWIGVSIFNHELCMPIFNTDYDTRKTPPVVTSEQYLYNGTGKNKYIYNYKCKDGEEYYEYDANVLRLLNFAKEHGKPVIFAELSPMNFVDRKDPTWESKYKESAELWGKRLFGLMSYNGAVPLNPTKNIDLRGVVQGIVYINHDWRYGFDGKYSGAPQCELPLWQQGCVPYNSMWFNDASLFKDTNSEKASNPLNIDLQKTMCAALKNTDYGFDVTCGN